MEKNMEHEMDKNMENVMETGIYGVVHRGYIGYFGVILGLYWGYMRVMEKNMEGTIMVISQNKGTPI